MATWITHLRLAEELLKYIPEFEPASFAIGNIAPDSGIPDEKWENFTPPPQVTHFYAKDGSKMLADLDFYRQFLTAPGLSADLQRASFLWGYFFHLVTDNLWYMQVDQPTRQRYADQFAVDRDFIWEVKRDWYGLDYLYTQEHPDSLYWRVFLGCTVSDSYLDFLPVEALRQRVEFIQARYQKDYPGVEEAYRRPYMYLSQSEMDGFVERASAFLYRAHCNLLKMEIQASENCITVLALWPGDTPSTERP